MNYIQCTNIYSLSYSLQYIPPGDLCGNCRSGYGVSVLLSKCVTCDNTFGTLIAVLSEHKVCILYILIQCTLCQKSCLQSS